MIENLRYFVCYIVCVTRSLIGHARFRQEISAKHPCSDDSAGGEPPPFLVIITSLVHYVVFEASTSLALRSLQDSMQDGGEAFSSLKDSGISSSLPLQHGGKAMSHVKDVFSLPSNIFSPLQDSGKAISGNEAFSSIQDSDPVDYGDFVESEDESSVEDYVEASKYYYRDLYYPICIGDVLAHRYRIEHKLGHGGLSTVWLARDIQGEKDVTLKNYDSREGGRR
jgi:hypothetical protein